MKRMLLTVAILGLLTGIATAAVVFQWTKKTTSVVRLTAELNNLGPNGFSAQSANIDNTIGVANIDGFTWCRIEAQVSHGANPNPNAAVYVWFIKTIDGTNFDDAPTGSFITGPPQATIPITQGKLGTRQSVDAACPFGLFRIVVQNAGSGQTWAASGNTVTLLFATPQGT